MIAIIFNEFTFIVIDVALGSIMAFFGFITYGKTKKLTYLFFVVAAFFLYLMMIFRVLDKLNIFILSEYTCNKIPIIQYTINYLPFIFMLIGFVLVLKKK